MRKIICPVCKDHLNPNDGFELPAEEKLCPQCIIKTNPGADLTKLVDSGGKQIEPVKKKIRKPREEKLKIYTEIITMKYAEEPKDVVILTFKLEDYLTKNCVFQFGLDFGQITELYEQMKEIDENPAPPETT